MTSVGVIVPWRPTPDRQAVWGWLHHNLWRDLYQDWQLVEGYCPESSPWCKAHAVSDGLTRLDRGIEILVVADADVWCDQVHAAVVAVENGAPWAVPHGDVHRLTEDASTAVLGGMDPATLPVEQAPYLGVPGGGIIAMPTETFWSIPLDPRFEGWGGEDEAWGLALEKLAGSPRRGDAPLWHLWHPPPPRRNRHVGSPQNQALLVRYQTVRTPAGMRSLVDEARRML